MKLRFFIISLFLLLFVWVDSVWSQFLPFRTYSIELGLSESVAYTLVQDNRGYIWVGTGYGLNRFDGKTFKQFYENDGLANNRVNSLFEDRQGTIWVGTETGISTLYGDSLITPQSVQELGRYSILDIFEDTQGNYWFGTDGNGLWKLQNNAELISVDETYGLPIERVRVVRQAADGTIWIGAREGLVKIEDDRAEYYSTQHGLPEMRIRDIVIDDYDRLWIATRSGLVLYENDSFIMHDSDDGLLNESIQTITVESPEKIWLGTEGGISLYDGTKFQNYTREQGVPAIIVYSSIIDREGNIWFGTLGGGITMYVGEYFNSYNIDNGLTNNVVTGFEEDADNNIWIATYGGGVIKYDGEEMISFTVAEGLSDNIVYTLFKDSQQRIWVGSRGGINIIDGDNIYELENEIFPFGVVRKIFEDTETNEFWISTYNDGIIRITEEGYVQHHTGNGFLHNTVMDIKQDDSGNYWFATYGGAARYDGHQFTFFTIADGLPSNGVIQIHIDHNNHVWFSTFNGIARFNGETVESITVAEGSETISYFTIQDRNNNYWVGTNRGLYYLEPEVFLRESTREQRLRAFRVFNQNQGLIANELNAGGSFLASDGSIWLGTVEGLSRFFPDRIRGNESPPGIEFEEILVSGKQVNPERKHQFRHDQNFVQFSYTGLSFEAPDQIIYEYRMKGLDQGWQTTRERTIRYPSLSAGHYDFELRAYNADGIRSEKTAGYSFTIMQPFYFQWWFLLLVGFFIVGMALFYMRYFRVRKQVDIERMRVQIASDLHDDVGSSLTELALQTDFLQAGDVNEEIKNTLKQIGDHSRKIVSSLDDIVWSIDSRNDTAGDLTDRMQDYVNQVFANGEVQFNYDFDQLRMHEKLPVDVKENVYLIFKESINNVVKHSNATKVDIRFSFSGKTYELVVSDNGTQLKTVRKTGQGLRNIKMRAERIGSKIEINQNGGFTVKATGSIK